MCVFPYTYEIWSVIDEWICVGVVKVSCQGWDHKVTIFGEKNQPLSYTAGFVKTVPAVYSLLMNTLYLS